MRIYYGEAKVKINPEEKVQNVDVYCHIIQDDIRRCASLRGYVYDAYTKKAIKHATIILENMFGNEICMSDSKGYYKMYMPCKNTWCRIKVKKHKRYRCCMCRVYIEKNRLNLKLYPRYC